MFFLTVVVSAIGLLAAHLVVGQLATGAITQLLAICGLPFS
jgi:hypothetical protein